MNLLRVLRLAAFGVPAAFFSLSALSQSGNLPSNLDSHLQELLRQRETLGPKAAATVVGIVPVDAAGRVRVRVKLNGAIPAADVAARFSAAGAKVDPVPELPVAYGKVMELVADVPVEQVISLSQEMGVQALLAWYPARITGPLVPLRATPSDLHPLAGIAGQVASQAAGPLGVTALQTQNAALTGTGNTIAIISDSYNTAAVAIKAPQDVSTNNLPGVGNPAGNTSPVVLVGTDDPTGKDEGRAMIQLVYGLAPKAHYCVASSGASLTTFAAAIAALAKPIAQGGTCGANVIVDDIGFPSEPMFGDFGNPVSTAANTVFSQGIVYLSSAGNVRGLYDGTWSPITDSAARAGTFGNLKLGTVPASATAGGFQSLATGGSQISFSLASTIGYTLALGWNDPFSATGMTSDYNLLVFDASGNYLPALSSTTTNASTAEAVELVNIPTPSGGVSTTYQFVITAAATPGVAQRLRIIPTVDADAYTLTGITNTTEVPAIFGHPAAAGSIGTGAYAYSNLNTPEPFSSGGPFTNYFDASGNRLATPEVRQQPMISSIEATNTSFFGQDSDGDGLPNFSGTSASAPTASAVAALALQASSFTATPTKIMQSLIASASHNTLYSPKDGYGYINAVKAANSTTGATSQVASTTVLTSSSNPGLVGSSITLTATVSSTAASRTGRVDFFDGTTSLGTATLSGNIATFVTSTLALGAHSLSAAYSGDTLNLQSTGTLTQTISAPTLTVTGYPSPATIGTANNVTVTAKDLSGNTLTAFTGTVTLTSSDTQAILPVAYTYTVADAGVHLFSVTLNSSGPQTITATSGSSVGTQTVGYVDNHLFFTRSGNATSFGRMSETGTVNFSNTATGDSTALRRIAFDNAGNAYSIPDGSAQINKLSPATGAVVTSYTGGGFSGGRYIAVDGQSQIFTANQGTMSAFDATGTALSPGAGYLATTTGRPSLFSTSVGIVIDVSGAVWIGDNTNSRLIKVFGAANPTVGPFSVGLTNNTLATRP